MACARQFQAFILAACIALAGCASMGVPSPETFNQNLAVAVASVSTARDTAATLMAAGKISREDAINIQRQADVAREGLDVARQMHAAGDATGSVSRLEVANAALRALQTYLVAKQGAPK